MTRGEPGMYSLEWSLVDLCRAMGLIFLFGGILFALGTAPNAQTYYYITGESPKLTTYLPTLAIIALGAGLAVFFFALAAIVRACQKTADIWERLEERTRSADRRKQAQRDTGRKVE